MPPRTNQPSDLELQVLSTLWETGSATVREVLSNLPDGKQRAYTTILTVLQNMEKKGLVKKTNRGTAHVYSPTQSQDKTLRPVMHGLIQNVFRGSVSSVMQHLLNHSDVSDKEIQEIRQLIDQHRKNKKGDQK